MKTFGDGILPEHNPQDSAMIEVFASRPKLAHDR